MVGDDIKVFTLMVVGDNPDEIIKKYDSNLEVEPYIKFSYKDMSKYRKQAIKMAQSVIDNSEKMGLSHLVKEYFEDKLKSLKKLTDFEYYTSITNGCSFDEEGNALSTENPDAKYNTCRIGRNLCLPLKLKNGTEVLQAKAGDVDWGKMHMDPSTMNSYRIVWELFHGERKPQTAQEKQIYRNIKLQKRYFEDFETIDSYVTYSCSYWCYAYADKSGWQSADDYKNYDWITGFYNKFVKKLKPDDLITIYECSKDNNTKIA